MTIEQVMALMSLIADLYRQNQILTARVAELEQQEAQRNSIIPERDEHVFSDSSTRG